MGFVNRCDGQLYAALLSHFWRPLGVRATIGFVGAMFCIISFTDFLSITITRLIISDASRGQSAKTAVKSLILGFGYLILVMGLMIILMFGLFPAFNLFDWNSMVAMHREIAKRIFWNSFRGPRCDQLEILYDKLFYDLDPDFFVSDRCYDSLWRTDVVGVRAPTNHCSACICELARPRRQ